MQTETKRNTQKSNNIAHEQQLLREIHKTMWNRCILNYILKRPKTFSPRDGTRRIRMLENHLRPSAGVDAPVGSNLRPAALGFSDMAGFASSFWMIEFRSRHLGTFDSFWYKHFDHYLNLGFSFFIAKKQITGRNLCCFFGAFTTRGEGDGGHFLKGPTHLPFFFPI